MHLQSTLENNCAMQRFEELRAAFRSSPSVLRGARYWACVCERVSGWVVRVVWVGRVGVSFVCCNGMIEYFLSSLINTPYSFLVITLSKQYNHPKG